MEGARLEPLTCKSEGDKGRTDSGGGRRREALGGVEYGAGKAHMDKTRTANIPSESWGETTGCYGSLNARTPDIYKVIRKLGVIVYKSKMNSRTATLLPSLGSEQGQPRDSIQSLAGDVFSI